MVQTPVELLLGNQVREIPQWTNVRLKPSTKRREYKGKFCMEEISPGEMKQLLYLRQRLDAQFAIDYGKELGIPKWSQCTYRPHPTGPEPMHYDKEEGLVITAFVNLSTRDRVWSVGPTRKKPGPPYQVQAAGVERRFAPGSLWIVRAETVAHQIVSGDCCLQFNWHMMQE